MATISLSNRFEGVKRLDPISRHIKVYGYVEINKKKVFYDRYLEIPINMGWYWMHRSIIDVYKLSHIFVFYHGNKFMNLKFTKIRDR